MLRIGVMLDSWKGNAWIAGIIEGLQGSSFARVELVILNTPPVQAVPPLLKRLKNHWKVTLYNRYEEWDYRRNRTEPDSRAERDLGPLLESAPRITVDPIRKGFSDYIRGEDLAAIREADLDVILRFGFRILRGGILDAAHYGIWSFHHGDNRAYRGGPPLFWEVYRGDPASGTILQVLTSSLDAGKVIYRGHSATNLRSVYRNRNPIYWKTAEFVLRRLKDLDTRGWEYIRTLPTYNETDPLPAKIYRTPHTGQMLAFGAKLFGRAVRSSLKSRLHGGYGQWFMAIRRRTPGLSFHDSGGYKVLSTPRDRFYADPFLFSREGKTFLFFEDYRYHAGLAHICCAEIGPDGTMGEPVDVLKRPYHLSYPFVFEDGGQVYMIPETRQNGTVELYRAEEFPWRWTLDRVLLQDVSAVDATIHRQDGKWWMFVGLSNGKFSNCDELALFFSDSLSGPWQAHPQNPVVSDVRRARPGGALFVDGGRRIRPSQDCARAYGYALVFSEVTKLDETEYEEREIGRVDPDWKPGNMGTHTYTRSEEFEVIDGNLPVKFPKA